MSNKFSWFEKYQEGFLLRIHVQPGASKSEISGFYGEPERLKVRIKAPPMEGKANKQVVQFISTLIGVRKDLIHLMRGETSRQKDLYLEIDEDEAANIIKLLDINSFSRQN